MKVYYYISVLTFSVMSSALVAQNNIGIGTTHPVSKLQILGTADASNTQHGILVLGTHQSHNLVFDNNEILARYNGTSSTLHLQSTGGKTAIGANGGYVGIGTSNPQSRLQVFTAEDASNTQDGALLVGAKSGHNLVMDGNELIARNNGSASILYLQSHGGNTIIGIDGGNVNIGSTASGGRLNVEDDLFQLYLTNNTGDNNDWYIGASNNNWQAGDDQLIFSPTGSSADGILRLNDVSDNDGSQAPVAIVSGGTQRLLLDGNEIDANGPLYINHNTDQNTYINPTGGRVAIGNTNPSAALHVKSTPGVYAVKMQRENETWALNPRPIFGLEFWLNGIYKATIDRNGNYNAASDKRLKENFGKVSSVLDKVMQTNVCTYNFRDDDLKRKDIGVIAQELQQLFPELVNDQGEFLSVAYAKLGVIALKAIQEQQEQIENLEERIQALEDRL